MAQTNQHTHFSVSNVQNRFCFVLFDLVPEIKEERNYDFPQQTKESEQEAGEEENRKKKWEKMRKSSFSTTLTHSYENIF